MVTRSQVVQGFLDLFSSPRYLEIGVSKGETFHALKAAAKVAVDPRFAFDAKKSASENPNSQYHQIPSDQYFGTVVSGQFDVIYLDGLHTLEQTLRDLINAIVYLKPNGVIVIDDIVPTSYLASLPDLDEVMKIRAKLKPQDKSWMGDVYRLVFFIQSFCQPFTYRSIVDNHGQLVVWRCARASVPLRSLEATARTPYEAVILEQAAFNFAPYSSILSEVREYLSEAKVRHD